MFEHLAEIAGVLEAALHGDLLDRSGGGLQHADREAHLLGDDKFVRRNPFDLLKPAREMPAAASGDPGQLVHGDGAVEVFPAESVDAGHEILSPGRSGKGRFGHQRHQERIGAGAGVIPSGKPFFPADRQQLPRHADGGGVRRKRAHDAVAPPVFRAEPHKLGTVDRDIEELPRRRIGRQKIDVRFGNHEDERAAGRNRILAPPVADPPHAVQRVLPDHEIVVAAVEPVEAVLRAAGQFVAAVQQHGVQPFSTLGVKRRIRFETDFPVADQIRHLFHPPFFRIYHRNIDFQLQFPEIRAQNYC